MELYAAQARKAASDKRREEAAAAATEEAATQPASMLETEASVETETSTETVQQKYIEEAEKIEEVGNHAMKMEAARSMQRLQYWIDHPEEHEKEIQRMVHATESEGQRKARFLQSALQNGTYMFMGKREHIYDKSKAALEGLWAQMRNQGGDIRPPLLNIRSSEAAKQPTAMLELQTDAVPEEHAAMEYNAFLAAIEDIQKATTPEERKKMINAADAVANRALGEQQVLDQLMVHFEGPALPNLFRKATKMEHRMRESEEVQLQEVEQLTKQRDNLMAKQENGENILNGEYELVQKKLDDMMARLKKHQALLQQFHASAHYLHENVKWDAEHPKASSLLSQKEEATSHSLLSQKEELNEAVAEEETVKRGMLAAEANQILRSTSKLFKRSLKRWEKAEQDLIGLLLKDAKGPTPLQDMKVRDAAHRAQTAQLELHGLAGTESSFLEAAQHRMMSLVAREAAAAVEARGEVYPSLDKCTEPAKELKNQNLAMDSTCVCIADQA